MRWRLRWQRRRRRRDRLSRRDGEPRAILLLSEAVLTLAALLHPAPAPRLNSPSSPSLRQRAASRRRGCAPSASTWRRCASDCVHLALERTRPAFPRRRQLLHHRRQPRRRCPLLLAERSHPSSSCGLLAAANRARAAVAARKANQEVRETGMSLAHATRRAIKAHSRVSVDQKLRSFVKMAKAGTAANRPEDA